jgi:hypothetical protein
MSSGIIEPRPTWKASQQYLYNMLEERRYATLARISTLSPDAVDAAIDYFKKKLNANQIKSHPTLSKARR